MLVVILRQTPTHASFLIICYRQFDTWRIELLFSNEELRLSMGERGQILSRQFDRRVLARKMLSVLQNVTL